VDVAAAWFDVAAVTAAPLDLLPQILSLLVNTRGCSHGNYHVYPSSCAVLPVLSFVFTYDLLSPAVDICRSSLLSNFSLQTLQGEKSEKKPNKNTYNIP